MEQKQFFGSKNLNFPFFLVLFYAAYLVEAYHQIYSKNYAQLSTGCASVLSQEWLDEQSQQITDCSDTACSFTQDGTPASVILPSAGDIQLNFRFKVSPTDLYQIIGVDITYISSSPTIFLNLVNDPQIETSSTQPIFNIEDEPGTVSCPNYFSTPTRIYRASAVSHSTVSTYGMFTITRSSPSQFLGIRSIKVWIDCLTNCSVCSSSTECSSCLGTFLAHTEVINSVSVLNCEVTDNCLNGCRKCYTESGASKCSQCLAGFQLQNSVCFQNQPSNALVKCDSKISYFNPDGSCSPYSQIAYYQDSSGGGWFPFIIEDPTLYKCNNYQLILAMNRYNYKLIRCACIVSSCQKCNNKSTCLECSSGYYYQADQTKCLLCQIPNCKICQDSYGSSCTRCVSGYILSQTTPLTCVVSPCPQGQAWSTTTNSCQACTSPYYVDKYGQCVIIACGQYQIFDTAENQCMDCENGQVVSNGICIDFPCDRNETFETSLNECVSTISNIGEMQKTLTKEGYTIVIEFQQKLKIYAGYSIDSLINIIISEGRQTGFSYEVISVTENKITVSITPQVTFKMETLKLSIIDTSFNLLNSIQSPQYQSSLDTFVYLSKDQKDANEAAASLSEVATTVLIATIIPIAIFSNFYVIINTIDITGFLYYLLFIDVRYPENVLSFFGFFQNFQFPFIPSMFESIISSDYVQEAPQKFIDNGFQPYFLSNSGQSITIVTFILGMYGVGKVFSYVKIPKLQPYLVRAMKETWEFSAFFDLLWSLYIYFLIGSLLQFLVYDSGEENYILNYILHTIFAAIHILCPFMITSLLFKQKNLKSDLVFQKKFATLVGGIVLFDERKIQSQTSIYQNADLMEQSKIYNTSELKCSGYLSNNHSEQENQLKNNECSENTKREKHQIQLSKLYNGILYLRKFVFGFIIVFGTKYPYLQLCLLTGLNCFMAFYIFYIMPLESRHENIKNAIGEIILMIIQACVILLVDDDPTDSENDRIKLGWMIVGLSGFIMLWHTLQMVIETLRSILTSLRQLCKKKDQKYSSKVQLENHEQQLNEESPKCIEFNEKEKSGQNRQSFFNDQQIIEENNKHVSSNDQTNRFQNLNHFPLLQNQQNPYSLNGISINQSERKDNKLKFLEFKNRKSRIGNLSSDQSDIHSIDL